ncbi:MAG: glycosyltransferase, partial [Chloroflexota bacterium]
PGSEVMHIEVVDDCSTKDDPEAVVREMGQGRVDFFRQPSNVGAITNFNTCVDRSQGQLVHILHGDDLVQPNFYQTLGPPLLDDEMLGAGFCRQMYVDNAGLEIGYSRLEQSSPGILTNALAQLAVTNRIQPPAIIIKRKVYEQLGGYNTDLFHSADWEMWVRIAAHYPIWYEPQPLALYRIHGGSDTSRLFQTGANIQDRRHCIESCRPYWPVEQSKQLFRKSYGYSAVYALRTAYKFLKLKNWAATGAQLREATFCLGIVLSSLFGYNSYSS